MMEYRIDNILFDLDGTLTNPKEGIVNSILYALDKLSINESNISELINFIGPPLRESFKTRYNLSDDLADKAMTFYREYFSVKGLYENEIYPGIKELLESLSKNKFNLYLATSKPTVYANEILKHFSLDKHFKGIIGSNMDNTRTDKTEIISYAISAYRLLTNYSVMVGDRKFDIIGAKNNAITSISVTYGYGSLEEILSHNPDFIVNNCGELKSILLN